MSNARREANIPFGGKAWYDLVREETQKLLDQAPNAQAFCWVERYTSAPETHTPPEGGVPGYVMTLEGGRATLKIGVDVGDVGDLNVDIDWQVVTAIARLPHGEAFSKVAAEAAAQGKVSSTGSAERSPISLDALHNAVAQRTA